MTTIACNLDTMAADSFCGDGNTARKLYRSKTMVIGVCGELYWGSKLAQWVMGGKRGACPPWDEDYADEKDKAHETELLILNKQGIWRMDGRGIVVPVPGPIAAIGSGRDMARTALWVGCTPTQAVEAACQFDSMTKGPVVVEHLRRPRK